MDSEFSLNVNKISNEVKVVTEPIRTDDLDIYDLRRQIEARQVVKDYIRAEILRLQQLLESMTRDIIGLDLKLRDRKPAGEPKNKRYLYAPDSTYELKDGEENSIATEIVE
jgi:hypothetical protein